MKDFEESGQTSPDEEAKAMRSLRSQILSYRYQVDRLADDHQRMLEYVEHTETKARAIAEKHNNLVHRLRTSRVLRLARKLLRGLHRLRHGTPYLEDLNPIELPVVEVNLGSENSYPELPDLPLIDYRAEHGKGRRSWRNTNFLSFYFYNELDQLLSERRPGTKGIFVQTPIIDWFVPLYQRPQHMALAMARQGYLVFYQTTNSTGDQAVGFHEVYPNVFITNQPVESLLREGALYSFYSTVATLLAWGETVIEDIRRTGGRVAYEYIDHIDPEISFHTTNELSQQLEFVSDATIDIGVASAAALQVELEAKLKDRPVVYVPNGVDQSHYDGVMDHDRKDTIPPAMAAVIETGRPIVGYFGALAPWLWYEMINELTEQRQDLSFVFIGPDYLGGQSQIVARENVYLLGAVDYAVLPYYAQHFDLSIIPFKPGDIARTTSPLKLFEYFALGKPVVVTSAMDECLRFECVLAAASTDEFSLRIDEARNLSQSGSYQSSLREIARQNSWDARAEALILADERAIEQRNGSNGKG